MHVERTIEQEIEFLADVMKGGLDVGAAHRLAGERQCLIRDVESVGAILRDVPHRFSEIAPGPSFGEAMDDDIVFIDELNGVTCNFPDFIAIFNIQGELMSSQR